MFNVDLSNPVNQRSSLNNGLVGWWHVLPQWNAGGVWRDLRGRSNATLTNGPVWRTDGLSFDGTNDYASAAIDLSSFDKITVSFRMYVASFTTADGLALEYTANFNSKDGFNFNPNDNTGVISFGYTKAAGTYWLDSFTRPSAAAWHHYVITLDRANRVNTASVDGVSQSVSTYFHDATAGGTFANSTLYFSSRAGTSLYGACRLNDVRIHGRLLSAAEIKSLYVESLRGSPATLNRVRRSTTYASLDQNLNLFRGMRGGMQMQGGFVN